jgi:hypothetical protein
VNESHEKKRSAALAYLANRKLNVLDGGKVSWNPAATDVRATINRARSRANLKNVRGVKA